MMIRGKDVAFSLLVVGTAAAAGYVLQSGRTADRTARSKADIGARIVDRVPANATVVDVSHEYFTRRPSLREAIERAVRTDAREQWANVTVERDGAWSVVDAIRTALPYHEGDGTEYNGVYVRCGDRVVVLNAIGWARVEEPLR
ncbi:hypothetical protein OB905_09175 [Halobacteria archaeon AArc-dxtr1]|nr:hypothetical protein [Halobacteria archaeon AArc-dxtr1]